MSDGRASGQSVSRRSVIAGLGGLGMATLATPAFAQIAPRDRKLSAFCVGIDRYATLRPLERAGADAKGVAARLSEIGYETKLSIDPGYDALFGAFDDYVMSLDRDTAAFVFVAGHGLQVAGRNFLLPADIGAIDDAEALNDAIALDSWLADLNSRSTAQAIVVLDACRNGGVTGNIARQSNGLASTNAPGGIFVAYSAAAGEFALDKTADEDCSANGLFTRHFIEELEPDAYIYDVITNTRAKVIPEAREVGHSQHPAIYDQSSRPYRIDGARTGFAPRRASAPGSLEGTGLILVAASEYSGPFSRLMTPRPDVERLGRVLSDYGAHVEMMFEPRKADVVAAAAAMGNRGFAQYGFYYAGMGGLIDGQAAAILQRNVLEQQSRTRAVVPAQESSFLRNEAGDPNFEVLSHGDVTDAILSGIKQRIQREQLGKIADPNEKQAAGSTRGVMFPKEKVPWSPMFLMFDACLDEIRNGFENLEFSRSVHLADFNHRNEAAVLAASSFHQVAFDAAPGTSSSPFTIALLNALAIPGLSLRQFSNRVRDEVETLTNRKQVPRLFAGEELQDHVFVSESERLVAAGGSCA